MYSIEKKVYKTLLYRIKSTTGIFSTFWELKLQAKNDNSSGCKNIRGIYTGDSTGSSKKDQLK